MARSKYPGLQILYEVGTRRELAQSYGVSERTMYRWINRAKKEATPARQSYPGAESVAQFKGTRKQLAQAYGISERTAYRWINKARSQGTPIPSRRVSSKYPGQSILYEYGSNRELGELYNVSETTIRRWKNRAQKEAEAAGMPEEVFTPDQLPEEVFTPDQLPEEIFTEDQLPEEVITEEEPPELEKESTQLLYEALLDNEMLSEESLFYTMDHSSQLDYLKAYIEYQADMNPSRFYDKETHDFNYSTEFVATINIWGDEFETWLQRTKDLEDLDTSYIDDL